MENIKNQIQKPEKKELIFPTGSPTPKVVQKPVRMAVVRSQRPSSLSSDNACVVAGRKYFPPSQWDNMALVIQKESGGRANAVSRTNDHGCFQIHDGLQDYGRAIYNPELNARVAYAKYKIRGYRPWYAVRGILW